MVGCNILIQLLHDEGSVSPSSMSVSAELSRQLSLTLNQCKEKSQNFHCVVGAETLRYHNDVNFGLINLRLGT